MKRKGAYFAVVPLLTLALLFTVQASYATVPTRAVSVAIVMDVGSLNQMEVLEGFQYGLPPKLQKQITIKKIYVTKSDAKISSSQINKLNSAEIVIAIGSNASRLLSQTGLDRPVLNIFLPRTAYRLNWEGSGKRASAIFLEQPPERYGQRIYGI